jgi:hypothetical protein
MGIISFVVGGGFETVSKSAVRSAEIWLIDRTRYQVLFDAKLYSEI